MFWLSIPFWSDFIPSQDIPISHCNPCFQSHFGLILSIYENRNGQKIRRHFQSHFGLILSVLRSSISLIWPSSLSIPFWSDFIIVVYAFGIDIFTCFQSHFGLILSPTTSTEERAKRVAFNPILVWFYRGKRFRLPMSLILSIPFWSDFIQS